jgi:hypothetical protein
MLWFVVEVDTRYQKSDEGLRYARGSECTSKSEQVCRESVVDFANEVCITREQCQVPAGNWGVEEKERKVKREDEAERVPE